MIKFRTEYKAEKSFLTLDPNNPVVLMGSCFSANISQKMIQHGWEAYHIGGTLYNPLSIYLAIKLFLNEKGKEKFEESLFFNGEVWHSRYFDSSFSSLNREDSISEFIKQKKQFLEVIEKGKTLIVTFGTSISYFLKDDEMPVGNCHKQPAGEFFRRRLSIDEIGRYWEEIIQLIKNKVPTLNLILTVSPVRHLKDGFTGNSRSKSILLLAAEDICSRNENCHYFPSYEIVNDDLRDYRFYAEDLVHPSEEAIEYIWENFQDTYLNKEGKRVMTEEWKNFRRLQHRPMLGALSKPLKK